MIASAFFAFYAAGGRIVPDYHGREANHRGSGTADSRNSGGAVSPSEAGIARPCAAIASWG